MDIAVYGTSPFILGFQLAGVRRTVEIGSEPYKDLLAIMQDPEVGIIITDEEAMGRLKEHERYRIERSVKPTVIMLSATSSGQENLRKMIMKAIGVDLLRE